MNNHFKNKVKGFLPLFFLLALFACKKESTEIGADLRKDKGGINSNDTVFTDVSCRTVEGDTFTTHNLEIRHLGVINDPVFGLRKSSLVIQPRLGEFNNNFVNPIADSAILILKYDRQQSIGGSNLNIHYGDTNSVIELDVYELDEPLSEDTYGNNYRPNLGNKIGEYTGTFNINTFTTGIVNGDTVSIAPELKIKLNQSFAQELLSYPADAYESQDNFLDELRGIVVVPRNSTSMGDGAIVAIEAQNIATGILLYYTDTDGAEQKAFPTSSESVTVNYYENDLSADILTQVNGTGSFDRVYPQSFGATKVRVEVPELNQLIEQGEEVVINEAEITFTIDDMTLESGIYDAPLNMFLLIPDSTNPTRSLTEVVDEQDLRLFSTGSLSGNQYTIHFNRYLQYLITQYNETGINLFDGFYLDIPRSLPARPYRVVLNTDKVAEDVKVSIIYTKLN